MSRSGGVCHPSSGSSFTDKQGQYLAFIYAYTRIHRRPPAEADMQRHFQVSPPTVHQMVLTLERAGLIRRQPGVARSIEVLVARNACLSYADPNRQNFCEKVLVRGREPERLDPWLQRTQNGAISSLRRFAKRLSTDYDAVRAAVTLDWSNGPVEGQINRLKTIKRQMYGRASLDLLERRFLPAA